MAKYDNNPYLDVKTHLCRKFDDTRGIIMIPGWTAPKLVRLDFVHALNQYIATMVDFNANGEHVALAHKHIEHAALWLFNKGNCHQFENATPMWIPYYVFTIVKRDWAEA